MNLLTLAGRRERQIIWRIVMETLSLEYDNIEKFLASTPIGESVKQIIVAGIAEADYRHSCEGKTKYGHLNTAIKAAESLSKKLNEEIEAYPCRHCENGFHIGHKQVDIEIEL